jgi:hypothetical protein
MLQKNTKKHVTRFITVIVLTNVSNTTIVDPKNGERRSGLKISMIR